MSRYHQKRIHEVDRLIREGTYPSVKKLAQELEVSNRTILRDLAHIRDHWYTTLAYSRKRGGYYYTEPNYGIPAIHFSEQELLALLIARHALMHSAGIPLEEHLEKAFAKITNSLPEDQGPSQEELEKHYSFRFGSSRPVDPIILDCIIKAIQKHRCLELKYYGLTRDEVTTRTIEPYHLDNLRGDLFLVGFCHLRKEMRIFSVNRIQTCHALSRTFSIPADFSYEEFIRDAFGILRTEEPEEVLVEFRGFEARLVRERRWHPSQVLEDGPDGSLRIRLRVTGMEEVMRWVMACGKEARVLEPAWLARQVEQELSDAAACYKVLH